jgi:hypothetical protein
LRVWHKRSQKAVEVAAKRQALDGAFDRLPDYRGRPLPDDPLKVHPHPRQAHD